MKRLSLLITALFLSIGWAYCDSVLLPSEEKTVNNITYTLGTHNGQTGWYITSASVTSGSVTIPSTVYSLVMGQDYSVLGTYAFYKATNLKSIDLTSVTNVKANAF